MKFIFLQLLFFAFNISLAQDSSMVELRSLFYLATISESYIVKAKDHIASHEEKDVFGSYRSMIMFMEAKYAINPYTKINYFKKARNKMEETLKLYPNNLENRFLRFAIQCKLPNFLGYNKSKKEDKEYILKYFKNSRDQDLRARIKLFFKESKVLSDEEYNKL